MAQDTLSSQVQTFIERLVPGAVRRLNAYHVAPAKGLIKLDAMENPYPWPEPMVEQWLQRLRTAQPNRYPEPQPAVLIEQLKVAMEVPSRAELVLGNGSDELIQLVILALGGSGAVIMAPEPSFAMYRLNSEALERQFVGVALDARDYSLNLGAFLDAIETHQPAVIFLAYPNNPTGNLFDRGAVEAIIEKASGVVVLDEAYAPFAKTSFMADLARHPNLLVMRTVSKLGLAGLRLGLLAGHPAWIEELGKLRLPYNINALTQISAEFALEHYDVFLAQTEAILAERAVLFRELSAINQIQVWPSEANFLLVRGPAGQGPALVEAIRDRGVLVRNFHGASPLLSDCIRVSVGTPEENQTFLNALRESLRAISSQ